MTNQNKELEEILDSFHNKLLSAIPFDNDPTKEESNLIEDIWDISTKKLLAWRDKSVNEARLDEIRRAKAVINEWRTVFLSEHDTAMSITNNDENVGDYAVKIRDRLRYEITRDLDERLAHLNKKGNSND